MGLPWRSLRVKDDVEEQQADGGEDNVVAEEQLDPQRWVALAGEDRRGGLDHRQQSRNEDGKENQREQQFAVAAADGERGKEDAVSDQRPRTQRQNQRQQPGLAGDVQVIKDKEKRRQNDLDNGDKKEIRQHFGQIKLRAGSGNHALRIHHLMADFARPGLVERADRGE